MQNYFERLLVMPPVEKVFEYVMATEEHLVNAFWDQLRMRHLKLLSAAEPFAHIHEPHTNPVQTGWFPERKTHFCNSNHIAAATAKVWIPSILYPGLTQ